MTAQEIEEVKSVAEFMGHHVTEFQWNTYLGLVFCDEEGCYDLSEDLRYYSPNKDWSDLMPVVEKIESLGYKFQICRRRVELNRDGEFPPHPWILSKEETKMRSVYCAVVKFIKWHNTQKK